jgi:DUF4097 and DUF4098 domain-containing protein YvlB
VIRIVLFAAMFALAAEGKRMLPPKPPSPPAAPKPPVPPEPPDDDDDREIPEPLENVDLPRQLGMLLSRADDDEDEDDAEQSEERDEHGNRVRIYRLNDFRKLQRDMKKLQKNFWSRSRGNSDEDFADDPTVHAKGTGSAALAVNGPVTFRLNAQAGDIEVTTGDKPQVLVTIKDAPAENIALHLLGDRVEVSFAGHSQLRRGKMHVELPRGSRVDLSSMSGDVTVQKLSGEARVRTMSGDVKLAGVGKVDVQTISGDARIDDASGPVRLHTVSGHAVITATSSAPQLEFQSASGDLDWSGLCARDCHVSAETVSGVVRLAVDPKSSFELSYTSHSGEMRDELSLSVKHAPRRKHGMLGGWLEATYGKGEGVIEADAFSGNLVMKKK